MSSRALNLKNFDQICVWFIRLLQSYQSENAADVALYGKLLADHGVRVSLHKYDLSKLNGYGICIVNTKTLSQILKLPIRTIHNMVSKGRIPAIHCHNDRLRFDVGEVIRALREEE